MLSIRSYSSALPTWRRQVVALAGAVGAALLTGSVALAGVPTFPLNMIVGGSTTVFPTANGVATGPYATQFGDTNIAGGVTQPGSGVGIQRLLCNQNDVATASRPLNIPADDNDGTTVCATPHPFQTSQVDQWVVGKDGITIIVHCGTNCVTGVSGLTRANLASIYNCTATNWSTFGGPNQQIVAESREITSGTYGDFMGFIGLKNANPAPWDGSCVQRQQGNPLMQSSVSTTDWSVAYVGFGFSTGAANLAVLPVSNNVSPPVFVTPSATTVDNNTYPFARQLFMMTLKYNALPTSGVRLDNFARAINFVNSTTSQAGQTILNNDGEFTLDTTPAMNPVTAQPCVTIGAQTACPQIIPAWDVNLDGVANVNDFVSIGQVFLDSAGSTHGGWERQDVTSTGTVNVNSMVNVGQHFLQTWTKWTL